MGPKVVAIPGWKEGQGFENGDGGGGRRERVRLTVDEHRWWGAKPSHQAKAIEEEGEDNCIRAMDVRMGGHEGKEVRATVLTEGDDNVDDFVVGRPDGIGGGGGGGHGGGGVRGPRKLLGDNWDGHRGKGDDDDE